MVKVLESTISGGGGGDNGGDVTAATTSDRGATVVNVVAGAESNRSVLRLRNQVKRSRRRRPIVLSARYTNKIELI